jgi:hypothetical protein
MMAWTQQSCHQGSFRREWAVANLVAIAWTFTTDFSDTKSSGIRLDAALSRNSQDLRRTRSPPLFYRCFGWGAARPLSGVRVGEQTSALQQGQVDSARRFHVGRLRRTLDKIRYHTHIYVNDLSVFIGPAVA